MDNLRPIQQGYGPKDLRRLLGISRAQLRYWEMLGYIQPTLVRRFSKVYRRYPEEQFRRLQGIMVFLARGYTLAGAMTQVDAAVNPGSCPAASPLGPGAQQQETPMNPG